MRTYEIKTTHSRKAFRIEGVGISTELIGEVVLFMIVGADGHPVFITQAEIVTSARVVKKSNAPVRALAGVK